MLFSKRNRNVIRWVWIVMSVLIILSMVVTYSGFTLLPATSSTPSQAPSVANQTPPDGAATESTLVPEAETALEPPVPQLEFDLPAN